MENPEIYCSANQAHVAINHGILFQMGSYGSRLAHLKTGRRHMHLDHFETLSDPPKHKKQKTYKHT